MTTPTDYEPKKLCNPGQLAATMGTLYTVPANKKAQLTSLILVNDSTTPTNATIHLVSAGGSADDTNILCKNFTVPGDGMPYEIVPSKDPILEAGDTIQGVAGTANVITYHISGAQLA